MDDDDIQLVALIDGELHEEAERTLLARIEDDESLRARCEKLRDLAAGFAAGLIVAGAVWLATTLASGGDDWRDAVVDYMSLYTNETFALPNPQPEAETARLRAVGERSEEHTSEL